MFGIRIVLRFDGMRDAVQEDAREGLGHGHAQEDEGDRQQ
jgi:hypothetical protein